MLAAAPPRRWPRTTPPRRRRTCRPVMDEGAGVDLGVGDGAGVWRWSRSCCAWRGCSRACHPGCRRSLAPRGRGGGGHAKASPAGAGAADTARKICWRRGDTCGANRRPAARAMVDERIRVVVCHELATSAATMAPAGSSGILIRRVYWFQPLMWWACRQLRGKESSPRRHGAGTGVAAEAYAGTAADRPAGRFDYNWASAMPMAARQQLERESPPCSTRPQSRALTHRHSSRPHSYSRSPR